MVEYQCKLCGAPMFSEKDQKKPMFCSKKCYGAFLHLKKCEMDKLRKEPDMPMMKDVSDDGFVLLVGAIVKQASWDVVHAPVNSAHKISAEKFFVSDHFAKLTGLDGAEMLDKLQAQSRAKKRKKNRGWVTNI